MRRVRRRRGLGFRHTGWRVVEQIATDHKPRFSSAANPGPAKKEASMCRARGAGGGRGGVCVTRADGFPTGPRAAHLSPTRATHAHRTPWLILPAVRMLASKIKPCKYESKRFKNSGSANGSLQQRSSYTASGMRVEANSATRITSVKQKIIRVHVNRSAR